ncbi:MAG: molybdopterin molybdotransferase MoeA [Rubellimicrobium sp.]|nr:molybdopterin molybdotransferase MoeA [Rubellimicrobium sp.]
MIPVEAALAICLDGLATLPAEAVPIGDAHGRMLAEPVRAGRAQPPFPASAMDGYALRHADAAPGARLPVVGEAPAGHGWPGRLNPGEAVRIFTGAPVPEGADTVVIQEDVTREGDWITLNEAPAAGANIRAEGNDFTADFRLDPPRRLGAPELALLAAMNCALVPVVRRPVVALVPTGDELVLPGASPRADQIVASNIYALAAMAEAAGALARLCPIARDDPAALDASLAAAEGADLIVTIGGASVGDHDLVAGALAARGVRLGFHKVALRPGKPLMSGRAADGTAWLGLPGNPVSAIVCGQLFLLPMIRRMLGVTDCVPSPLLARLEGALPANGPRAHYMRARMGEGREGRVVQAFDRQDSSLLTVLSEANCLLVRPPGDGPRNDGDMVDVLPMQ